MTAAGDQGLNSDKAQGLGVVILAGGQGRRMGCPKAHLMICGQPVLCWMTERFRLITDEIIVALGAGMEWECAPSSCPAEDGWETVAFSERLRVPEGVRVTEDALPDRGPLCGLAAGLQAASHPWVFVTSCDAPLTSPELARFLYSRAGEDDGLIPLFEGRRQPLQSLYHRRVVDAARERVDHGLLRMRDLLEDARLRMRLIEESEWVFSGISPLSFLNVNTPGDLALLREAIKADGGSGAKGRP